MGQLASAFGVPQETALKWLAPPRVAAAASRGGIGVGAVIFTPSSGEINYLGVGGQHRGCGAAAALVRFAEEAMQVADLFIAALVASVALGFSWVPSTPGPQTPDRRWHSRTAQAPE